MTPTDYKNKGYKVSLQMEQAVIDKAEATAMGAYILPILPDATTADNDVKNAVMALAFLLMCYDGTFVTRSGAKGKNTPTSSENKSTETIAGTNSLECARLLDILKTKDGAEKNPKIVDVAKIYFSSNYFHL